MSKILTVSFFILFIQGCSSNKLESDTIDLSIAVKDVKKACKELSDDNYEEFLECFKINVHKIE